MKKKSAADISCMLVDRIKVLTCFSKIFSSTNKLRCAESLTYYWFISWLSKSAMKELKSWNSFEHCLFKISMICEKDKSVASNASFIASLIVIWTHDLISNWCSTLWWFVESTAILKNLQMLSLSQENFIKRKLKVSLMHSLFR